MARDGKPLGEERRDIRYIRDVLWPEFLAQFIEDNKEYPEERPLGAKAEWHGMHRKVGKLQAPIWDGQEWTGREPVRRMFQEIVGHAFLAIASLDYAGKSCSTECSESHTYGVGCSISRMLRKPDVSEERVSSDCYRCSLGDPCSGNHETAAEVFDTKSNPVTLVPGVNYHDVLKAWGGGHSRVPVHPAPVDETELDAELRRERGAMVEEDAHRIMRAGHAESQRDGGADREAAWRVRHCGPGCAYAHRYSGDCINQE